MLTVHAAVPGRMANSQVSGYAAAAFQPASNGAPLQMYGSNSGRCPARMSRPASTRSGRFWVGQVVSGEDGVPEQRGEAEDDRGRRDEHDHGHHVARSASGARTSRDNVRRQR